MDEALERLRQQFQADPDNLSARTGYLRALLKLGRIDEFRTLAYETVWCRFDFSELRDSRVRGARFCDHCKHNVHFANNEDEAHELGALGEGLAIYEARDETWLDQFLINHPDFLSPTGPCLIASPAPWLDVSDLEVDDELVQLVPAALALQFRCLPVARDDKVLTLATDTDMSEVLGDLRFMFGSEIDWVLTDGDLIDAGHARYYQSYLKEQRAQKAFLESLSMDFDDDSQIDQYALIDARRIMLENTEADQISLSPVDGGRLVVTTGDETRSQRFGGFGRYLATLEAILFMLGRPPLCWRESPSDTLLTNRCQF